MTDHALVLLLLFVLLVVGSVAGVITLLETTITATIERLKLDDADEEPDL
ncbi:hypothetical protein vBCbaSRXM_107 [Citromicrobium phage vB_CbaS-RXM]|nr:hypothetical protein vBCbaSRXM_107 [Citromicrobium phage vB_CbaS-RXM]